MSAKAKAIKAATRALGPNASAIVFGTFVRGYMVGHAAHTRSANKRLQPFISKAIEELKVVEREIGVPSKALALLGCSSQGEGGSRNGA